MSTSDDDEYGSMPDEDLIELESQASQQPPSQTLPQLPPLKRRRISSSAEDEDEISEDETTLRHRRKSRHIKESEDGVEESEESKSKQKKEKYKILIHGEGREAPKAMIVGATQADGLPDSSPSRIRGPIYKRPRPEAPKTAVNSTTQRRPTAPLNPSQRTLSFARTNSGISQRERDEVEAELLDLPSDAFSSSPESAFASKRPAANGLSSSFGTQRPQQRIAAPQTGLRQTTLFGGRASQAEVPASQVGKVHNYRVDMPPEVPTQHTLDYEALKTWVYPTNLGEIRDYQYSIVKNGLFNNLLVALPTGLGKTFIAATIMFNYFRWTKDAKIIFVAPTKPLVSQQVEACFNIVGIPRSATVMLTGEIEKSLRAEEWLEKRVFFMTPQTLENDLKYGYADPKKIVLLVVDEAHRATGTYAYVNVVKFLRQFNKSFRVLALTATPGAKVEKIQEVIDSLEISKVEIRTEESIDIQQFVHRRDIEQIVLDPSEEMVMIYELYSKALQPLVNILCSQNSFYNKDPMALTPYGMIQAKTNWVKSDAGRNANQGTKYMMYTLFTILGSLAHGIKMLHFHGIGPFFATVKEFRQEVEGKGDKGSKYKKQIVDCPEFKQMMDRIQMWLNKDDFVGHPKMTYLCDTVLNHFLDAGEGRLGQDAPPSTTRVIVFSEYRDSAEEITRVLNRHGPMVRASVFVGQADSKRSAGMNQAAQQETIRKFKTGTFNVLVATSIGEEGLDIGQVDLIVCYDSSASPIRMLQRMGRTGRKRAGKIVLLLLRGKEEQSFVKSKDNYEKMQQEITSGARLSLRHDLSARIIPRDIKPVLEKRVIEIPVENTQDPSMPEPKRRGRGAAKKAPKKKFHMPDGVETGFRKASKLSEDGTPLAHFGVTRKPREAAKIQLAEIPKLESVLLSPEEEEKFHRNYLLISGADVQEVEMPNVTSQTVAQRRLSITVNVPHGRLTKRCVRLFKTLAKSQLPEDRDIKPYGDEAPIDYSWSPPPALADEDEEPKVAAKATKPIPAARKQNTIMPLDESDESDEGDEEADARGAPARKKTRKRRRTRLRESEDEGESIDKSDTEEVSGDESEDVGSLKDFLASEGPTVTRTSTATVASSPVVQLKEQLFFEPTQFTATQDTNDDMPDIGDLLSIKKPPKNLDLALSSDEDISDREVTTVVTKKIPVAKDIKIGSKGDISDWEATPVTAKKISVAKSSKSMRIGSDGDISDSGEPIKPVKAKPFARPLSLDISSDEDDDDHISDEEPIPSTRTKSSGRTLAEDSDEDVRPITGRKKRRTVVEDDDSDE